MSAPITLHHGDCLAVMADLPENSFDAVITDPPYHLTSIVRRFGAADAAPAQVGTDGLFKRASSGFMGKEWDGGDIAFRVETWAAALRVLKPGGHLVAFSAARTYPAMALAIEAAGFEVRDSILSLYSSGEAWAQFLDTLAPEQTGALVRAMAAADAPLLAWLYGCGFPKSHNVAHGIAKLRGDRSGILAVTAFLRDVATRAGITLAQIDAHMGTNGMAGHWTTQGKQAAVPNIDQWEKLRDLIGFGPEMDAEVARLGARKGEPGEAWKSAPVIGQHQEVAQAARWREDYSGKTARPAGEIRDLSSIEGAAEWEGWGTALKPAWEPIVLARKPLAETSVARQSLATGTGGLNIEAARIPALGEPGRWPANVASDGSAEVLARFPVDAGASAARFFYSAKADARDRAGSSHPTVKPQALMRWLVRLLTARGAHVLDPFGGSGSTAWASATEGRRCTLIEREPEYAAHIRRRIAEFDPAQAAQRRADDAPLQAALF